MAPTWISSLLYGIAAFLIFIVLVDIWRNKEISSADALAALGIIVTLLVAGDHIPFINLPDSPNVTDDESETSDILFEETFEDSKAQGVTFGLGDWQIIPDDDGNMILDINNTSTCCPTEAAFGSVDWNNYAVEYRVKVVNVNNERKGPFCYLYFRKESGDFEGPYYVQIVQVPEGGGRRLDAFFAPGDPNWSSIDGRGISFSENVWYKIKVEAQDNNFKFYIDDILMLEFNDSRIETGSLGIAAGNVTHLQFDDIRVVSLGE